MTKQEYSTLIAQMAATIYAGGIREITVRIAVGAALEIARISGIEKPKVTDHDAPCGSACIAHANEPETQVIEEGV